MMLGFCLAAIVAAHAGCSGFFGGSNDASTEPLSTDAAITPDDLVALEDRVAQNEARLDEHDNRFVIQQEQSENQTALLEEIKAELSTMNGGGSSPPVVGVSPPMPTATSMAPAAVHPPTVTSFPFSDNEVSYLRRMYDEHALEQVKENRKLLLDDDNKERYVTHQDLEQVKDELMGAINGLRADLGSPLDPLPSDPFPVDPPAPDFVPPKPVSARTAGHSSFQGAMFVSPPIPQ